MRRCPTPAPWLLYIFPDRGQDLERARSSAALNLWRVVHVFSADGPWATGGGLLRADFCRPASFFCVEGVQGCHCFSWELSLACRAPGTRAKCMHSKVLKICTNVVLVLVRGSTRSMLRARATWGAAPRGCCEDRASNKCNIDSFCSTQTFPHDPQN